MNSETTDETDEQPELPKINFSGLVVGTPEWIAVRTDVMNALHVYGTFEAVYDPQLDPKLREKVFKKCITELFDLPTHVKSRSATYTNKLYVPSAQGITVYQGNPNFCDTMQRYAEAMKELSQMVTRMIMEDLGVENKYYDEMNQKTKYVLNASCYKSEEEHKDEQYMGAHTDPNFITIIGQDEVDGLEVLIKTGQWIRPAPNCYIVLIADAMEAWTNGRLQAIRHRVIKNKSNDTRYATLFVSTGAKGFIIQTPPELIDVTHPVLYKPFDFNDYFQFYSSKMGFKTTTPLKTFCGIDNPV